LRPRGTHALWGVKYSKPNTEIRPNDHRNLSFVEGDVGDVEREPGFTGEEWFG